MKQQYPNGPSSLMFLCNSANDAHVYINGHCPNMESLLAHKEALDNFVENITEEEIQRYNDEYYEEIRVKDYSSGNNKKTEKIKIKGWIYVYKSQDFYKIGRSKYEDCRLKKYITENPHELILIHKAYVEDYIGAEKELHDTFADRRHSREWFRLDELDIKTIKKMYA